MQLNPIYLDLIDEKIDGAYKFPFYLFCHRIPERTFNLKGHYFPICARCTGIWISGIGFIILTTFSTITLNMMGVLLAILMIIPMLIDGISQLFGKRDSNNTIRFFTGLLAGTGIVVIGNLLRFLLIPYNL